MLRVCGATVERDALSRSTCWCRGMFCGRGGGRLSKQFRHETRKTQIAKSIAEFQELLGQADLFAGDDERFKWLERLRQHTTAKPRRVKR